MKEFDAAKAEGKLVVIDFTASWCGPCQMIAPVYEAMSVTYSDDVLFYKVDVDETDDVASACGISAMPTFQFYKGGAKVDEMKGADQTKLKTLIEQHK
jgi:thioredoxin